MFKGIKKLIVLGIEFHIDLAPTWSDLGSHVGGILAPKIAQEPPTTFPKTHLGG